VLESLLSESVGLEHLILDRIEFVNALHREDPAPGPPRVVLNSLRLVGMDERAIRCILSTFTVVDIKHLRWFTCDKSDLNWMLEANGRSIQRLEILGSAHHPSSLFLDLAPIYFYRLLVRLWSAQRGAPSG
jgi:hypothetical protein